MRCKHVRLKHCAEELLHNRDGVTAIEFALISPVLMLLVFGVIEISMINLAQNVMEDATFAGSRGGKTGYVESGHTREETIINIIEEKAGVFLDTERLTTTSLSYQQFDQIGDPEPFVDANGNGVRDDGENYTDVNGNSTYDTDMGAEGSGDTGEIVVYTVTYPWEIMTPLLGEFIGNSGTINLSARAVVKNEPF